MTAREFTIAGVDGCRSKRGQWLAVLADADFTVSQVAVHHSIASLVSSSPSLRVIGIDIPIGLPSGKQKFRQCDLQAQEAVGPRRSSVFLTPPRVVLDAPDYPTANEWVNQIWGKGFNLMAFHLLKRIRDVDSYVRAHGQGMVKEIHPEVCFKAMKGGSLESKKTVEGLAQRLALLTNSTSKAVVNQSERDRYGSGAKLDDLYDALAALWTARRILEGNSKRLPENPEKDAEGLLMEINY
ncbi:MAG: DUF429 domain-containing protein [Chloroflexi bacterium]|nr:DUF429 domain-containing protein [Chloroflexota bacterium]